MCGVLHRVKAIFDTIFPSASSDLGGQWWSQRLEVPWLQSVLENRVMLGEAPAFLKCW